MTCAVARELAREIAALAKVAPHEVGMDAHFVVDLGLSSLDILSMLALAEARYGVTFPDSRLHSLSSLRDIEQFVLTHRAGPTGEAG